MNEAIVVGCITPSVAFVHQRGKDMAESRDLPGGGGDMPPIIFLDIDGVLVPDGEGVPSCHQFHPRCVEALRLILAAARRAKVVFSTTWRLPLHVNRLHEQWTARGFPEGLAIDGTPDLREETSVPRMYRRGHEIRAWLEAHPEVTRWVVVDDERLGIEPILGRERCVFTNPDWGLTADDAERAVGILLAGK